MRWIIKIILFPISLLLSILTAFLTFLLSVGTAILYLLMLMCVFVAIGSFFMLHNTRAAILSSKLPQAKDFKRWVTTEVLPSIRKNGGYIKNQKK